MRGLLAIIVCLLLSGCMAQADEGRDRGVFTEVREAVYSETFSGDLSDAESGDGNDTSEEGETALETDESALYGDFEEAYWEPVYELTYYEPADYEGGDFRTQGVVYDGGTVYTWYSERILPGQGLTELNGNGRDVNDDGYVVDCDGYIAVASSDHERGAVIETPFGDAKVYDTGCPSGVIDVYTAW